MFVFVLAIAVAIALAVVGGLFFTLQANVALSLVYLLIFFWGIQPKNREGLPGVLGYIATHYSIICLVVLWGIFYFATGQTVIQNLFTGWDIQILR